MNNRLNNTRGFLRVVVVMLAFATFAFAQGSAGRLTGTISSTDGVIPGATVVVRDDATNRERTIVTNDEGGFVVPQLESGNYTVTITAEGFKTFTAADVKIDVGREYTLNPTLEAGNLAETITIIAGADILNATTAEISSTVSTRQIQELPLNGRDPLNLIQLQAGVASNGQTNTSINGQRPSLTNITRDGINVQDQYLRGNASSFSPQRQTVDTISEFTVTTSNAGAELGYGASHVQQVTPRGQREFNGALFAYNRNDYFGANEFFNNAAGRDENGNEILPRPRLNRNQFGGRLSGPMPLPRFGEGGTALIRDKGFFFAAYEGLRQPIGSTRNRVILTPSARQGIFTYIDDAGATQTVNLLNPRFGLTAINPVIQSRIFDNLPTAGNANFGDSLNTTGFSFNQGFDSTRDQFTTRLDYDISDRHSLGGVFSLTRDSLLRPDFDDPEGFASTPIFSGKSDSEFFVTAYRYTPSANFTNEVRGGYFDSRVPFARRSAPPSFIIAVPLISSPEVSTEEQGRTSKNYNLQDNAQYQLGNHSLRFGGVAQLIRVNSSAGFTTIPTYTLGADFDRQITEAQFNDLSLFPGGIPTNQRGTANNLLALLGGLVDTGQQTFNATRGTGFMAGAPERRQVAFENIGLYFSDQWRATPRLTLNLGVRYDLFTPVRDLNSSGAQIVIPQGTTPAQAILDPNAIVDFVGRNAGGNKLFKTDLNNFAPVLSFAYSPQFKNKFLGGIFPGGGRTVIRGGYSLAYANDEFIRASISGSFNTGLTATSFVDYDESPIIGNQPTIPVPTLTIPRPLSLSNQELGNFAFAYTINPDIKVVGSHQYNFGIQREIGFNTAIEIRYVGGFSNNLWNITDFNQINIRTNGFLEDFNVARSNLLLVRQERARRQAAGEPLTGFAVSGAYNPNVSGSRQLTLFNNLGTGFGSTVPGVLNTNDVVTRLTNDTPGSLAQFYIQRGLLGTTQLQPNPSIGSAFLLDNVGKYNYNSLQTEIRKRFSQGLQLQANYTFSKTLANFPGLDQGRFEPRLDNTNPGLEYTRADYDQTHRFNFNSLYELPFGRNKRFFSDANGLVDRLLGGFQFGSIIELGSGSPITITDGRGTLNLAFFSGRNTPFSNLSKDELKNLFGRFERDGVQYFINPDVLQITRTDAGTQSRATLGSRNQLTGAENTFPGQVFFLTPAGQVGNVPRAIGTAPIFFNVDASLLKNIRLTEGSRLQLRAEAFNVFNRANFDVDRLTQDINSATFGQISTTFDPRVLQFAVRFEF